MSTTRIKDLTTTPSSAANDDYIALDGATNGTRKILASNIGGGGGVTVDSAMSNSSTNPVQNKIIYAALQNKADTSSLATVATTGDYDDLIDAPALATVATSGSYNDLPRLCPQFSQSSGSDRISSCIPGLRAT